MEQIIHDEKNGLDYQLVADYYLPMLKTPRAPQIGRFGRMHYDYIRKHNKVLFSGLWLSGDINGYIEQIDRNAEEMFSALAKELAQNEGVTEQLKAVNQMLWVQKMCNIRNRATEIVIEELIYT